MNNEKENTEIKRNFKGVWIPKEVWLNNELTWMEKLFLVEIDSLDNEKGCFASNDYFAKFFNLSKARCSQIINSLIEKKYVGIIFKTKGKQIIGRVLNILNRGIKNIKHKNNIDINNKYLSKDKYKVSEETYNDLEENNSPKKIKQSNIPKNNFSKIYENKNFLKIITLWNNTIKPASKHNIDINKNPSKTIQESYKLYNHLKNGTFGKYCTNITKDFISKNNIEKSLLNKKWSDIEIRRVIKDCSKQFEKGYYPYTQDEKNNLPKTLQLTFYNPFGFPSTFLKVASKPPIKKEQKPIKIKYENSTKKYFSEFFDEDMDQEEKNKIIRLVNNICDKHEKIVNREIKVEGKYYNRLEFEHTTNRLNLEDGPQFVDTHIEWIHSIIHDKGFTGDTSIVMSTRNGWWKSFVKYYENKYDVLLYPSEEFLVSLCIENIKKVG